MATASRRPTTFVRSDAVQRVLAFSALLLMIVFFSVLNPNFGTFNNDVGILLATTVNGIDYLLTWNCRHIANAELHRAIRRVIEEYGYEVPSLCTPEKLMGEEQ